MEKQASSLPLIVLSPNDIYSLSTDEFRRKMWARLKGVMEATTGTYEAQPPPLDGFIERSRVR